MNDSSASLESPARMSIQPRFLPAALIWPLLVIAVARGANPASTFCNPLNLDYGIYQSRSEPPHRHGADPVVVLFKDRYWLFSTWDRPGYRVSDDLVNWKFIPFAEGVELPTHNLYTAAAASVIDGWLYFTEFRTKKQLVGVFRTQDPGSGTWETGRDTQPPS